jgi:hypothetical protein
MKRILCLQLMLLAVSFAQQPSASNAVPDEATAVKIAEKTLTRIYGKKIIEAERPFTATLTNGVWHVGGTLYCKDEHGATVTVGCRGGVAEADIEQRSGHILKTQHGR